MHTSIAKRMCTEESWICIRPAAMGATRGRCTAPWQAIIRVLAAISREI